MPEAMVVGLPEHRDGGFAGSAVERIAELAGRADAVVAGMGVEKGDICKRIAGTLLASDAALALDAALLHSLEPLASSAIARARMVGGLLARGAEPLHALLWAVWLHGSAGERLAQRIGPVGFLAREIPDEIPALLPR
jgi:NAD(P)H-hydrate repair Nnr-like enzyme with NAD(P)H-hydrate dehydratase domain